MKLLAHIEEALWCNFPRRYWWMQWSTDSPESVRMLPCPVQNHVWAATSAPRATFCACVAWRSRCHGNGGHAAAAFRALLSRQRENQRVSNTLDELPYDVKWFIIRKDKNRKSFGRQRSYFGRSTGANNIRTSCLDINYTCRGVLSTNTPLTEWFEPFRMSWISKMCLMARCQT